MAVLIRRLVRAVAILGVAALVGLSLVMMADIVGREFFATPVPGFSDVTDLVIVIAATACFPASVANNQHIAVRFAGMLHWRLRDVLDLLGHLLMLAVLVVVAFELGAYAADVYASRQTTWLLGIPVWPIWVTVTALFAICALAQVGQVTARLGRLPARSDPEPAPPAAAAAVGPE